MMNIFDSQLIKKSFGIFLSSKAFPYGRYLITVFPIYAILINAGLINSIWSLLFLLPFVFSMIAGFVYNTICDAKMDPPEKNPLTRNQISKTDLIITLILMCFISALSFTIIYQSFLELVMFLVYLFLWLGYSGFGIRFKETIIGPPIASTVLFVGAPIILLIHFNFFNPMTICLVAGLFLVYTAHEAKHTLIEYDLDLSYNCKTFAVILGKQKTAIFEYLFLFAGFILLLITMKLNTWNYLLIGTITILFVLSILSTIIYGVSLKYDIKKDILFNTMPYIATRLFIVIFSCFIIGIDLIILFFMCWLLLLNRDL